ncbi:MAG TPA: glycerophosphodiester phosphodiesterase family protein [Candidatus Hydrogenedentes bacterium]|nr:glycerophosphodiester phosphodiesterase family protein [Candidatus Hydrogenedentota bacterium]HQE84087.1 glycerophosphodiester phosphodiesterase family protein [Candidatus Hydrogenedentota bacterium]HQH52318.1 glycerophosphodiester phosphodiesterase family protein [Candidatus Hydrogenedentota bacterium]HQM47420.1 glycerophosphodiester phosphodiesterase family protein [Candidatus Hydrogenedentota bacterium]
MRISAMLALCVVAFTAFAGADSAKPVLPPPRHGGVYVVAHRGAHEGIPENSLPAYQKAIELGVDFVEVDARETKDGHFVSVHNSTIDSYAEGAKGRVADFSLAELKAFDIGARVGPDWVGTRIPTLNEILALCKGKMGIYMDFKEGSWEALLKLVKDYGMERHVLWYAPPWKLEKIREACPECIIMPDPGPETNLQQVLDDLRPRIVASVWKHHSETFVKRCHEAGAIVIADESDPSCWEQAFAWNTDGIQTDHPEKLVTLLKERDKQKENAQPGTGGSEQSGPREK